MAVKKRTPQAEQMSTDELTFWKRVCLQALPDCLSIQRTPEFCAHVAADVADAMVRELRRRPVVSR
jgi:hypothetical protein